jgi:dTMP kinase
MADRGHAERHQTQKIVKRGIFITFEGSEGCGKSTQSGILTERLRALGYQVRILREPGGTPIGEEIRHTLKHSHQNHAMTAEAELLLMNASRAQLVREVIRPALAAGEIVVCDRFYDSSTAYQGFGRQLDLAQVKAIIEFAVGETKPDLTLLLTVSGKTSGQRLRSRQATSPAVRDRIEEADQAFFDRVAKGFAALLACEPERVRLVNGSPTVELVSAAIWELVEPILPKPADS